MGWKKELLKGGTGAASKVVSTLVTPDVVEIGAKIGNDLYEMQKSLVRIPDLRDVKIDDAMRVLRDELDLTPVSAIVNPALDYAEESEFDVMYTDPKAGSRVNPKTAVKVYYLTQEVIDKSKELCANQIHVVQLPVVVGLHVQEAREVLEGLGLKVTEKLEKPTIKYIGKEAGLVTRVTYPDDRKISSKVKTGDRVWLYYVNEAVVLESVSIKEEKDKLQQERMDRLGEASKQIYTGAIDAPKNIAKGLKKPFAKKKTGKDQARGENSDNE